MDNYTSTALQHLKECFQKEVQKGNKSFSWIRTIHRAVRCHERRFYFWFRLWSYFVQTNKFNLRKTAKKKVFYLNQKYTTDINPAAKIGPGLRLAHVRGIVIREGAVIGSNVTICQGVTIGIKNNDDPGCIRIGDNVMVGANSCLIGNLRIGSNVTIGAMSLINKDVPDDAVVFSSNNIVVKKGNQTAPQDGRHSSFMAFQATQLQPNLLLRSAR